MACLWWMTKRSVLPAIGCNNSSARLPVRCSKVAALPRVLINTHAEEIEIKIEKENKEKQSACVCLDDTQPSDEGGAREQMPVAWRRLTIMPTGKMAIRFNMEYITCTRCGQTLPRSKLERMKTGTYRRVCNHCKWLYYVKPSRDRRILRELEARHHHPNKK